MSVINLNTVREHKKCSPELAQRIEQALNEFKTNFVSMVDDTMLKFNGEDEKDIASKLLLHKALAIVGEMAGVWDENQLWA